MKIEVVFKDKKRNALILDEIKARPGIYKCADGDFKDDRIIVTENLELFVVQRCGGFSILVEDSWQNDRFVQIDEELTVKFG